MSYKENIIKLLGQKVASAALAPKEVISSNKTDKRKRKKQKLVDHKEQWKVSRLPAKTDVTSNCIKPINNSCSSNNLPINNSPRKKRFVKVLSDSDIEVTSEDKWDNEVNANITPTKSEIITSVQKNADIDISIDNTNNVDNNIFLMSNTLTDDFIFDAYTETEDAKETRSSPIIYNIQNGKIVILKDKDNFYIHGSFKLSVLYGNINLLGYESKAFHNEIEVHSLRGFSHLCIENTNKGDQHRLDPLFKEKLSRKGVSKSDVKRIVAEIEVCDTILLCSPLSDFRIPYIEKHISQRLLPAVDDCFPVTFTNDQIGMNVFKCNKQWDNIVDSIDNSSKLMICGGKGVGKSTVIRYMINRLLMKFESVLVVDLDPGQSEFTIPGCISAVLVKQPIFGPNFTHLQRPERCLFIENIDITLIPDLYLDSVFELMEQVEHFSEIPTLINYMGYSQSFGIDMASSVISYVSPTVLLQINSTQRTKNFVEYLTPEAVKNHLELFGGGNTTNLSYKFITVASMTDGLNHWQAQGRTIRDMCVLSYFSEVIDSSLSLTSRCVPIYKILLKNITLVDSNLTKTEYKPAVFNANLVALCTKTAKKEIYNCHGWGIVRCIDQEHLVLITPVCEDILKKVTHLALGSVKLPPSILMYEDNNVGLIPYISVGCITTFNTIPKRSYLPKKQI